METTEKRWLNHVFSPQEITSLRKDITDKTLVLSEQQLQKKHVSAIVSSLQSGIDAMVIKVREGKEGREMQCPIKFYWDENRKEIIHPETLLVVDTMAITDQDREQRLPMQVEEPKKKKK